MWLLEWKVVRWESSCTEVWTLSCCTDLLACGANGESRWAHDGEFGVVIAFYDKSWRRL